MIPASPSIVVWIISTFLLKTCYPDATKIHPDLSAVLADNGRANVVVSFRDGVRSTLDSVTAVRYDNRGLKNTAVKDALVENSERSHAGVLNTLSTRSSGDDYLYYKQFWSSNKILIKEASAALVDQVSEDPEVKIITELQNIEFPENEESFIEGTTDKSDPDEIEWNLRNIQVPEAWAELGDNRGEGVVVGVVDWGVTADHEALKDNFRGDYGWYDSPGLEPEPSDENGHGTHVTGTLAGSHGIGVVPGAKWMVCKVCFQHSPFENCTAEGAMFCFQWMSCPTLADGTNPDCSKAPHVVSCSWGNREDNDEDLMVWRAMGIIPVFAVGNIGDDSCFIGYPGRSPLVIGVGATNQNNELADFSNKGSDHPDIIKPDVVAPGVRIRSAENGTVDGYVLFNGTSMAAPLVAGVIALLKVRDLDLTYEEAYELLTQNTDVVGYPSDLFLCPKNSTEGPKEPPNWYIGYGKVNALKAVQAQTRILNKRKK